MMATAQITTDEKADVLPKAIGVGGLRDVETVAYVEVLGMAEALEVLSNEWRALETAAETTSVFQSLSWVSAIFAWVETLEEQPTAQDRFVVLSRGRDNRLTGLWPVQTERMFGATFAVALGEPFNQYSEILVAPGADPVVVIDTMLDVLRSLGRFSGVIMRKVRDDAICVRRLRDVSHAMNFAAAPAVDLRPFDDFKSYHQTVKSKTRKNLRNARNRLERSGSKLEHLVHTDPVAVAEVAQRAFELRAGWLEQEGISSRAFLDDRFESFIQTLCAPASGNRLDLIAFELQLGSEMLSLQWGFIDHGRYYAFMAVRNPAFDAQSPGRLHLEDIVRSCAELGLDVVDFLAPDVDYKRTWATETVAVRDYGLAFTASGWLVLSGALGAPRVMARKIFDILPHRVRQGVIRLMAAKSD